MRTICIILVIMVMFSCNVLAINTYPEIDESVLLKAAQGIIDAQVKYYDIEDVEIVNPSYVAKDDGGYYVEYTLRLTMRLKYNHATELPQIRGLAEAFNIDSASLTTQEFTAKMKSSEVIETAARVASVEANKLVHVLNNDDIAILATTFSDSVAMLSANDIMVSNETMLSGYEASVADATEIKDRELIVAAAIADVTITDVIEFVQEVESSSIGVCNEFNYFLRAEFDDNDCFMSINYGLAEHFTDDINYIIPASEDDMIELGEQQATDTIVSAAQSISRTLTTDGPVRANTGFTYKKLSARDYAREYTSQAKIHNCDGNYNGHVGSSTKQDKSKYNPSYRFYCSLDCANYASQVMLAGGVPTSTTWRTYTEAWINGTTMKNYFYINNNLWSKTNSTRAAAGEFIQMINKDNKSYHTMIVVLNDTVNREYCGHTNDRLDQVYKDDNSFLSSTCVSVEFYRFDNYTMS